MNEPDIPPGVLDLLARTQARRQRRTEERAVFADRRQYGLAARHARKLARD